MLKLAIMVVLMLAAAPALAAVDCRFWPAGHFFETATVTDVHFCIDEGADVNERGKDGETPLLHAVIFSKDPAVIPALLAAGADPNAGYYISADTNHGNKTPLYHAVMNFGGDPTVTEALLAAGANVHVRTDSGGFTPLHEAVRHSENVAVVEALLAAGADVDAHDDTNSTPLQWAVMHSENPAIIEALIEAGADVNTGNDDGVTPLHRAAWRNKPITEALIGTGADVNARSEYGTPLHWWAEYGESVAIGETVAIGEALLAAGADVNARDGYGRTPLEIARDENRPDAVLLLLKAGACGDWPGKKFFKTATVDDVRFCIDAGADVNARGGDGRTPLHWAMSDSNPAVIEELIEAGADVNARDSDDRTPLQAAYPDDCFLAQEGLLAGEGLLVNNATTLLAAIGCEGWFGRTEKAEKRFFETATVGSVHSCIDAGAGVDLRDAAPSTPLHRAVRHSVNPAVIVALIEAGADVNGREDHDDYGATPLHRAVEYNGNLAVIETLLTAGADVGARDGGYESSGRIPLHWAVFHNRNPAVIEALIETGIEAGVHVNTRDNDGDTPLHLAVVGENVAVIAALIEAGADVNARNGYSTTPLHWAAGRSGNLAVVAALIEAGADVNARNGYSTTPLHWAADRSGNLAVVAALVEAGADVNARDKHGHTPLQIARNNNHIDAVSVLLKADATE